MSNILWLDGQDIFGFTVEKQEIPRPGHAPYYLMPVQTGIGVLHTTEGNDIQSALGDGRKLKASRSLSLYCW